MAGVDTSTQATKVLVVDSDDGRVVATGRSPHVVTGSAGARESDPEAWWEALATALAATGRASEVAAVAVGGQQHGLVVSDETGRPLRPAMLWNDTRSAPEARALTDAWGAEAWAERIGSVPVASLTVTKWAWLRAHEPETVAGARRVELPHDFLTGRLTGRHVTDRGDASGTGWWSTASEDYDEDVLSLPPVRLDRSLLPSVLGPREAAGTVVGPAAAALGLPEGIPVGPGTGDNMAAALGLGLRPGTPVVSLGTSGTVYAAMTVRAADLEGVVAGFADAAGGFLPLTATLNATLAVDRMAAWLGLDRDAVEPSGSVTVLPYLDGERTPNLPHAAGTIAGLRHTTTGGAILMAAYEGAAAGLVDALDRLAALGSGLDRDAPLVLIGGGARGRVWPEVVGRLSGRPLLIPRAEELVALGAAVQAAAILRDEDPGDVARRWRTQEGSERPAVAADTATLERIRRVRAQTADLLGDVDPR